MGHPYRERHNVASTTSADVNGTTAAKAKQQTDKSTTVAKKGKRSGR